MADNDIASQITHIFSQYSQELNKKLRALSQIGERIGEKYQNRCTKKPCCKSHTLC